MGVVYRARDMELNVDVALKLLRSDFPGDEKDHSFVQKADLSASGRHTCKL